MISFYLEIIQHKGKLALETTHEKCWLQKSSYSRGQIWEDAKPLAASVGCTVADMVQPFLQLQDNPSLNDITRL